MLLHDRASMAHALTLDLDPRLHAVLAEHIAALTSGEHDLTDWTEILLILPGMTEADLVREAGFNPLVSPIDGARWPDPGFHPFWDWLADRRGVFEMIITYGSTFATILLIQDGEKVHAKLLTMCRTITHGGMVRSLT